MHATATPKSRRFPAGLVLAATLLPALIPFSGCSGSGGSGGTDDAFGTPTGLSATVGDGTVTVSWSDVSSADGYAVYWSLASGFAIADVDVTEVSVEASPHTIEGLANGVPIYLRVTALRGSEESSPSAELEAIPLAYNPDAPYDVVATPWDEQVTLTWTFDFNASDYGDSFNVYWSTSSPVTTATGTQVTGYGLQYLHTGLTNGTTYYYIVTALNAEGEEGPASPQAAGTPYEPLAAPGNLSYTAYDDSITVSWDPVTGADGYNLYWDIQGGISIGDGFYFEQVPGATSPHTVGSLAPDSPYYFVVVAYNADGEGIPSAELEAWTTGNLPDAPTIYDVTPGDGSLTVDVSHPDGNVTITIYWSTTSGFSITNEGVDSSAPVFLFQMPYTITPLTPFVPVYIRAVATDPMSALDSPPSAEASGTPYSLPAAPSISCGIASGSTFPVSWSAVSGATSYNLYVSVNPGIVFDGVPTNYEQLLEGVSSPYIYDDLGNSGGSFPYYLVGTSENAYGEGAPSTEIECWTQPE